MIDQVLADLWLHFQRAKEIQTAVDEPLRRQVALQLHAADERTNTWAAEITQHIGGEVDPLHQGPAVDPLNTRVPPFYAGRVQELLSHVGRMLGQLANPRCGKLEPSGQPQETDDGLSGATDPGKSGVLEEVRVEDHPQGRAQVALRFPEGG